MRAKLQKIPVLNNLKHLSTIWQYAANKMSGTTYIHAGHFSVKRSYFLINNALIICSAIFGFSLSLRVE